MGVNCREKKGEKNKGMQALRRAKRGMESCEGCKTMRKRGTNKGCFNSKKKEKVETARDGRSGDQ